MGKKRNLNGTPGNLALSYLSTHGYRDGGYMADWLNFIARNKNVKKIEIDILNNKIKPTEADIKPLKADLKKLKGILEKDLKINGFEQDFIVKAVMVFEIPIDNPRIKNTLYCYPFIEDENGKIYKPKKRIIETAYEVNFNPLKIMMIKSETVKKNWLSRIREMFS